MHVSSPLRLPDFVVLGAAKSSSSWLHAALRRHPQIYMPMQATPFFEDIHYRPDAIDELSRLFDEAPNGSLLGIRRSNYLCMPSCAARIARHLPRAKLIAAVRQPADRAISQYFHLLREGFLPWRDADDAFADMLSGRFEPAFLERKIVDYGRYGEALANYRNHFSVENIFVLTDIELRSDAFGCYARLCRFLGIAEPPLALGGTLRRNSGLYARPLIRVARALNRRRFDYDAATGEVEQRGGLTARLAGEAVKGLQRVSSLAHLAGWRATPAVSKSTHARLTDFYRDDIALLERLLGTDLTAWLRG